MQTLPIRLTPGQDLRQAIEAAVRSQDCHAAFVLSGSVARNGAHLHMALSTATGQVFGGHVAPGCIVRTTAEVLLALLPEWAFAREPDAATGYDELVVRSAEVANGDLKCGQASGKAVK